MSLFEYLSRNHLEIKNVNKKLEENHEYKNVWRKFSSVKVVIGNESCDLDSAVSSILFSYLLFTLNDSNEESLVFPLLNVKRKDFKLHTEVNYWLGKYGITEDFLVFRDDLNLNQIAEEGNLDLYLVDHNVLSPADSHLEAYVVSVVDHHHIERPDTPVYGMTIEPVGSCSTLIASQIFEKSPNLMSTECAMLLYGTILVDTINLNPSAKRFTPKDIEMLEELELVLNLGDSKRREIFDEITIMKSDVSGLTSKEILHKDLKIVTHNNITVAIAGMPLLVQVFLKRDSVGVDLMESMEENSWDILVLMGIYVEDSVRRDMAVFSSRYKKELTNFLMSAKENFLQLEAVENENKILLFEQMNAAASRKIILPLIKQWLENKR